MIDQFARWQKARYRLIAPMLWLSECTSAIRVSVYAHQVSNEKARLAIEDLLMLGVEVLPTDISLCQSALDWAGRLGQAKAYDGFYLALAEQQGAEFWTADKRLANSARQQLGVNWVHSISNS